MNEFKVPGKELDAETMEILRERTEDFISYAEVRLAPHSRAERFRLCGELLLYITRELLSRTQEGYKKGQKDMSFSELRDLDHLSRVATRLAYEEEAARLRAEQRAEQEGGNPDNDNSNSNST